MRRLAPVLAITLGIGVAVIAAFESAYWQKIYPGVTVARVNLGNLSTEQAVQKLMPQLTPQPLILTWGTAQWVITPFQIGLEYDATQSAHQAYLVGRQDSLVTAEATKLRSLLYGQAVNPIFSWQENQLVEAVASISGQINLPAREPQVQLDQGQVVVSPGENGRTVDERDLRLVLQQAIITRAPDPIPVPVVELTPKLSSDQVQSLRRRAETLIDKKLVLTLEGRQWEIGPDQIFTWLDPSGWGQPQIAAWVKELATSIDRPPQNALFKYVGSGRVEEFKPAIAGLTVKQEELVGQTITVLNQLEGQGKQLAIVIPVSRTAPAIATADVNSLGIKELIGWGESNFSGSIANRVFNIKKAAGNLSGILVAPGETFSFNKYMGDISTEGGYKQAYIIKDGKTILGDGGGVCQVSTTLFRAALNTGLPIIERTAHAYRVHYYEQDSQPGFDATIFTPSVDFKFKNDTPSYLLIQSRVDEGSKRLEFAIYGTSDNRQATLSKSRVWDVVAPPPDLYTDDPTLPAGTVKQVDWKAWGAKAAFDYKVTRGDEVLQSRTFYSAYRPWQAVFLRGPQ